MGGLRFTMYSAISGHWPWPKPEPSTVLHFTIELLLLCAQHNKTMNRAKTTLKTLGLISRSHISSSSRPRLPYSQASQYHHFVSPFFLSSTFSNSYLNSIQQKLYFSSEPSTIVDLITTHEWSQGLEKELLEKFDSTPLTHETVVYILKKLETTPQNAFDFFNWVSDKHGFKPSSLIYSQMLRILNNKDTLEEFWGLSNRISEEDCVYIDLKTHGAILGNFKKWKMSDEVTLWERYFANLMERNATVNDIVGVVLESNWNDDMEKYLMEVKATLSENVIVRIFQALSKCPLKAYSFFRWLEDHAGYTHNAVTYNCLVRILAQRESIKEFWVVIKEMKSSGFDLDIESYIKISRRFGAGTMVKDNVELYELMMDGPYKPHIKYCGVLLTQISKTENPIASLVCRVVRKFEEAGNTLDKGVYDVMYSCLIAAGKFDEAEKILDTMSNKGLEPDKATYSNEFFGLVKAGKLEEAIQVLNDMDAKGCFPDLITWRNIIRVLCTMGEVDQALKFYAMLSEKNLEVDANFLDVLVNGLCGKNRVDSAYAIVIELVSKVNLIPSLCTCQILIPNLLRGGKLKEGMNLLLLMKKHGHPLHRNPFVDYISKFGTVDDAKDLWEAMSVRKYANVSSYQHILRSFLKEGRKAEARDLFYNCPDHIRNYENISKLFATQKLGKSTS